MGVECRLFVSGTLERGFLLWKYQLLIVLARFLYGSPTSMAYQLQHYHASPRLLCYGLLLGYKSTIARIPNGRGGKIIEKGEREKHMHIECNADLFSLLLASSHRCRSTKKATNLTTSSAILATQLSSIPFIPSSIHCRTNHHL